MQEARPPVAALTSDRGKSGAKLSESGQWLITYSHRTSTCALRKTRKYIHAKTQNIPFHPEITTEYLRA